MGEVPEEILYDRKKTVCLGAMSEARSIGIRCFPILRCTSVLRRVYTGRTGRRPGARWSWALNYTRRNSVCVDCKEGRRRSVRHTTQ
jgi:hypothetical protein